MASIGRASLWTIRRSTTDAKLTGLCGGVARHWNVDPLLVRIGSVLLAFVGVGLVLYAAGWLLVPADGASRAVLDDLTNGASQRWSRQTKLVVVAVTAALALLVAGGIVGIGIGPLLALAVVWYVAYYRPRHTLRPPRRSEPLDPRSPTPAAAPPGPAPSWPLIPDGPPAAGPQDPSPAEDPDRAAYYSVPDPVGLYDPAPTAPTLPERRLRARSLSARRLRLTGLGVLGLTLSGLGIADAAGAAIPPTVYVAAALLVTGLTLIAATWLGRAGGVLPIGVVLLIGLLALSVAHPGGMPRDWSKQVAYTSAAQLPTTPDRIDIGRLQVDLSRLALTRDATYSAEVDAGQLSVRVPRDVNVRIRYVIDQGAIVQDATTVKSGSDLSGVIDPDPVLSGKPTLTLDLMADFGELEVRR